MALIKLGALAQDVRGSLNGTTFSRNKGGAYVRSKVSPVQPVSAFSANSRQAFKIASQAWAQLLNAVQRANWIAFAALHPFINVFGDAIVLSGVAFFQAANKRLQQLGFAIAADAPLTWAVDPPGATTAVMTVDSFGAVTLVLTPAVAPQAWQTAYLFATKKVAPGAAPQNTDFRMVNNFIAEIEDETFDWGPLYTNRFSPYVPGVGDKIELKYAYLDTVTGLVSVPSDVEIFAAPGVPSPAFAANYYEWIDAGGGNATPTLYTVQPHGLQIGDVATVLSTPANPDIDGAGNTVAAVPNAFTVQFNDQVHAAVPKTETVTTIVRTA